TSHRSGDIAQARKKGGLKFLYSMALHARLLTYVCIAVALVFGIKSDGAQDRSTEVCTLSERQTNRAIAAFNRLMPVFHHDRCTNCHNKIDPFVPRGHVDIRNALQMLRDRRTLDRVRGDTTTTLNDAHEAIVRFLDGGALTPRQRVNFMFSNACSACHD